LITHTIRYRAQKVYI